MSDYYLAPSLEVLRDEINQRWPDRDKRSDGWIGDEAHQARRSDHNPNERGSVNAIDVDISDIDPWEVLAAFEEHPSSHYWIYDGQIADRDDGWRRRPYTGSNPHDKHLHGSIRQTREAEQNTQPWGVLDMPLTNADAEKVANAVWWRDVDPDANVQTSAWGTLHKLSEDVAALRAEVAELRAHPPTVTHEQLTAAIREVLGSLDSGQESP